MTKRVVMISTVHEVPENKVEEFVLANANENNRISVMNMDYEVLKSGSYEYWDDNAGKGDQ